MNILERKVSFFKTTKNTEVLGNFPIGKALDFIKEGKYKNQIDRVRNGEKSVKTQLPTVAMHGVFSNERKKDQFIDCNHKIRNRGVERKLLNIFCHFFNGFM